MTITEAFLGKRFSDTQARAALAAILEARWPVGRFWTDWDSRCSADGFGVNFLLFGISASFRLRFDAIADALAFITHSMTFWPEGCQDAQDEEATRQFYLRLCEIRDAKEAA